MSKTKAKKPASRKRVKEESPPPSERDGEEAYSDPEEEAEEEKKPVKTQKQFVDVGIRNFAMPGNNGNRDTPEEYKKKLDARNTLILREKERLLAEVNAPREDRSDKLLKWECEIKGIAREGIRPILLQRLANHDAGLAVMTSKHERVIAASEINAKQAVAANEERESIILRLGNGKGSEGLMALPHDLIRGKLLPLLSVFDLVCLARTCKYLCKDASDAILARSQALFGTKYGTRLAIGALMSAVTTYVSAPAKKRNLNPFYRGDGISHAGSWNHRNRLVKQMCAKFGVKYQPNACSDTPAASIFLKGRFPDVNQTAEGNLLERHPGEAMILRVCMEKYKSIEGFVEQRRLRSEKADLRVTERKLLEKSAPARLDALHAYLGLPLFEMGKGGAATIATCLGISLGGALLDVSACGRLFYALARTQSILLKAHKKCTHHVYEAIPVKTESAGSDFRTYVKKGETLGDLLRIANANGLSMYNVHYFEWVFTYLVGGYNGGYNHSPIRLEDKGSERFIPSACRLAFDGGSAGIDQLRNPGQYLRAPEDLLSLDATSRCVPLDRAKHCVILIIDTPEYPEIRILYVRQSIAFTERVSGPGKEPVGQREYILTRETILDALPPSDKQMKIALLGSGKRIQLLKQGPPATLGWSEDFSSFSVVLYMPVSSNTEAGPSTVFGGTWYRGAWLPFAPISVILK